MYQPVALFIGLRYMRGRASDRFGRFVSWLSTIGITLGVMALVTVLSVMNGFEKDLENNILGLMPQALVTSPQGSVNPQQLPASEMQKLQALVTSPQDRSTRSSCRPPRCRSCRASRASHR